MKKHLLAAAIATAVAAPAMAQNVSVYGTLDIGMVNTSNTGGVSTSSATSSRLSSSVLGFKGSEDLGGGLKAEFALEGSLNPVNGQLGTKGATEATAADTATTTALSTTAAAIFNREAWAGLAGSWGAIRVGKTDVSGHQGVDGLASNLGNQNDFIGDIGSDKDGVVRYTSPAINGLTFDIGYQNTSTTTSSGTADITGGSVKYSAGNLNMAVGYATQDITGGSTTQTAFGANYNAGVAVIGVALNKVASDTAATEVKETILSVTVPMGGMNLHASFNKADYTLGTATDIKTMHLGATKALSKRTSVYAMYSDVDQSQTTGADKKEAIVGIVHKF
jgi:predicted porin